MDFIGHSIAFLNSEAYLYIRVNISDFYSNYYIKIHEYFLIYFNSRHEYGVNLFSINTLHEKHRYIIYDFVGTFL